MQTTLNLNDLNEVLNYGTADDLRACLESIADLMRAYGRAPTVSRIEENELQLANYEGITE